MKPYWPLIGVTVMQLSAFFASNVQQDDMSYWQPALISLVMALIFVGVMHLTRLLSGRKLSIAVLAPAAAITYLMIWNFIPLLNGMNQQFGVRLRFTILIGLALILFVTWLMRNEVFLRLFTIAALSSALVASLQFALNWGSFAWQQKNGSSNPLTSAAKTPLYGAPASQANLPNIYYIMVDGMGNRRGLQLGGVDLSVLNDLEKELSQAGYQILEESASASNTTYYTFQSLFDLDYPTKEGDAPYLNRHGFYSASLRSSSPSALEQQLAILGYQTILFGGNYLHTCDEGMRLNCLETPKQAAERRRPWTKFIRNYSLVTFMENSLMRHIENRRDKPRPDALQDLTDYLDGSAGKPSGPQFFFIHQLMPHSPYYTADCRPISESTSLAWDQGSQRHYLTSMQCLQKRLAAVNQQIAAKDPEAIVVIQGDHGTLFLAEAQGLKRKDFVYSEAALAERFAMFNAMRLPARCLKELPKNIGNVNSLRFVLACAANLAPKLTAEKSYVVFYEHHKDFGKVFEPANYLLRKP